VFGRWSSRSPGSLALVAAGFTVDRRREAAPLLDELLHLSGRPLRTGDYDYAQDTLPADIRRLFVREAGKFVHIRPPAEGVMFVRAFGGLLQNLRMLGARGDFRPFYRSLLPLLPPKP
jgi:hypothetical protein